MLKRTWNCKWEATAKIRGGDSLPLVDDDLLMKRVPTTIKTRNPLPSRKLTNCTWNASGWKKGSRLFSIKLRFFLGNVYSKWTLNLIILKLVSPTTGGELKTSTFRNSIPLRNLVFENPTCFWLKKTCVLGHICPCSPQYFFFGGFNI